MAARVFFISALLLSSGGCLRGGGPGEQICSDGGPPAAVTIGLTDAGTLAFIPLSAGENVQLETFGQGGNHAALAMQIEGLGAEAYVEATATDVASGQQVHTAPFARAQPLLCDGTGCRFVNLLLRMGGLTDPEQLDGLPVVLSVTAHDGGCRTASADIEVVLLTP